MTTTTTRVEMMVLLAPGVILDVARQGRGRWRAFHRWPGEQLRPVPSHQTCRVSAGRPELADPFHKTIPTRPHFSPDLKTTLRWHTGFSPGSDHVLAIDKCTAAPHHGDFIQKLHWIPENAMIKLPIIEASLFPYMFVCTAYYIHCASCSWHQSVKSVERERN